MWQLAATLTFLWTSPMSFEDLKAAVAARAGLSKAQTGQAITAPIEHLQTSLGSGDKIRVGGPCPESSRSHFMTISCWPIV